MNDAILTERLEKIRIVPVVKLDSADHALPLADALREGGLPAAEITFRTSAAEASIRAIRAHRPEMTVGAGTVVTVEQAMRALDAGAEFLVSPGFSAPVVEFAQARGVSIIPGCCTPSEIMRAMEYGLRILKYFPADLYGGLAGIKALAAVFPSIRFMPTGGIRQDNAKEYLSFKHVIAVGGTWMVKSELIHSGEFSRITELTRESMRAIA